MREKTLTEFFGEFKVLAEKIENGYVPTKTIRFKPKTRMQRIILEKNSEKRTEKLSRLIETYR